MAVRIPIYDQQETVRTGGPSPHATPDTFGANVGTALAGAGDALSRAGEIYQADQDRLQRFSATKSFAEFNEAESLRLMEAQREARPDAAGFTKDFMASHDAEAKKFMGTLPKPLALEYQARLATLRKTYSTTSLGYELGARDKFYETSIAQTLDKAKQGVDQSPTSLDARKGEVLDLIEQSGLPAATKEQFKRVALQDLEKASFLAERRTDPRAALENLRPTTAAGVVDRIIGAESGGKADAKNPGSTATGAGQFIDETWLSTIRKYRPELAEGKSKADILALRGDATLSRQMTAHYAEENSDYLRARGIPVTAGNVYLAHFLGPKGAVSALSVDPKTPISEVVSAEAIAKNRTVLDGKTAGDVAAWAERRMTGVPAPAGGKYANIPYSERLTLAQAGEKDEDTRLAASLRLSEAARKQQADDFLREAFSRAEANTLTPDYVEGGRQLVTPDQYKNLLTALRADAASDDKDAIADLVPKIDAMNPDEFQKRAAQYLNEGKLKTTTYTSLSEKNRAASKDDQPASPFRSGRDVVSTTLDPGQLLSGPAAAIGRASRAQALIEFDNWYKANPRASRPDAVAEAQDIIKRYQIVPFDQMKLAVGTSPYFGNKARNEIKTEDIQAAETRLIQDMDGGLLTQEQQAFEIRRLQSWREILTKQKAADDAAKAKTAPKK